MMDPNQSMNNFLASIGCRRRGTDYILEEFDHDFYLRFDTAHDPETPDSIGTVDIHIVETGLLPHEGLRIVANATRASVMRFMFALGVERFNEATRNFLYESNKVVRAN